MKYYLIDDYPNSLIDLKAAIFFLDRNGNHEVYRIDLEGEPGKNDTDTFHYDANETFLAKLERLSGNDNCFLVDLVLSENEKEELTEYIEGGSLFLAENCSKIVRKILDMKPKSKLYIYSAIQGITNNDTWKRALNHTILNENDLADIELIHGATLCEPEINEAILRESLIGRNNK